MASDFLEKMKMIGRHYSSMRERKGREGLRCCWATRLGLGRPKRMGRGEGSGGKEVGCTYWAVSRLAHCGDGGKGGGEVSTGWATPGASPHGEEGEERGWAEPRLEWEGGRK